MEEENNSVIKVYVADLTASKEVSCGDSLLHV